jgi:formyltetrahydrofolate synthetase
VVTAGTPLNRVYSEEHIELVTAGTCNLARHIENTKKFGVGVVVAINKFHTDTQAELDVVRDLALKAGADACVVANHWAMGGAGAVDLGRAVLSVCDNSRERRRGGGGMPRFLYGLEEPLKAKIERIASEIYRASKVEFLPLAETQLAQCERLGWGRFPVCIAKTQYSFSSDPELKGAPEGHTLTVREARASVGAGFVFVLTGSIMTIPGLPTRPGYYDVDLLEDGRIVGLF